MAPRTASPPRAARLPRRDLRRVWPSRDHGASRTLAAHQQQGRRLRTRWPQFASERLDGQVEAPRLDLEGPKPALGNAAAKPLDVECVDLLHLERCEEGRGDAVRPGEVVDSGRAASQSMRGREGVE